LKSFKVVNGWLLLFLFIQTARCSFAQETEADLKLNADKLFNSEQFVEATPLFSHLIALNPRSTEYNYKYGTCLLFNSLKKQDAFKYLNFSITDPSIAPEAYFYLGKAYHLNFQFNEAIKNYNLYIQKSGGKPNPVFETDHQIEMCQNGKKLLTTISDLVVLEKKEIEYASFFRLYNLSNIGGVILITAEYQSKIDKKRNHTPLIHFPDKAQTVYYSSYGDSDKGSMDIYCRKRLPDGKWGLPALVPGNVNTKFDEDFPYLSPNGEYLYFCSKGHNSMGGFDVFRSKFDPESNSFGQPENMDFAISSPDNDLFYVVDSLEKNAYFASSRQSENGKIHVYKVRVDRVPLQLAIVKGQFFSSVHPENKKISIKVVELASGNEIGVFKSNDKGNYLITFPKGGKYTYEMTVDGSTTVHKSQVSIPFLKEFKPLKQKIQEELLDKEDVVRVVDQFNEEVDDAQGILAEVIRARAELNVNAGSFDINALDAQKENKKVLADIGLEGASNSEIISKFEQIQQKQEQKVDGLTRLEMGSLVAILEKAEQADALQAEVKKDVAKANAASTKEEKNDILLAANDKVTKIQELKEEIQRIDGFVDSISKLIPKEQEKLKSITELKETVSKSVIDEKYDQLKNAVIAKADLVKSIENEKESHPVDHLLAQNESLGKQSEQLKKQLNSYKESSSQLEKEIAALKTELAAAKAKDQAAIQSKIDSKEAEKQLVSEEVSRLEAKVKDLEKKEAGNTKQITFINNLQHTNENKTATKAEADAKVEAINSNNVRALEAYVKEQFKSIDTTQITARTNDALAQESKTRVEGFEADYSMAQDAVDKQSDLTHEEKVALKVKNNEQLEKKLVQELAKIEEGLAKNPSDTKLIDQKKQILTAKTENAKNKETILSESQLPVNTSTTPEKELTALMPNYDTELKTAGNNSNTEERLKAQNKVDENLLDQVDKELDQVYEALAKDPLNPKLQDKKEALTTLKKDKESIVKERQEKLDELESKQNELVAAVTIEKELTQVAPNYEEEKKAIGDKNGIAELKALNQLESKTIESIEKELVNLNPKTDAVSAKRKEVLEDLKKQFEENIVSRTEEINGLTTTAVVDPKNTSEKNLVKEVQPTYKENVAKIEASTSNSEEKTKLIIAEEVKLLSAIKDEQQKLKKIIGKNPTDSASINKLVDLDQLETIHEAKLDEQKQTAVAQAKAKLKDEQVRQEVLPTYQTLSTDEIQNLSKDQALEKLSEEKKLQSALEKQIQLNSKALEKDFSAEKTAENQVLGELLQQSKETEEELKASANKTPIEPINQDVASLETVLGSEYSFAMIQKPSTKEEAGKQLVILNELSKSIESKIKEEKVSPASDVKKIEQLEKQLEEIRIRKEIIEAETPVALTNPTSDVASLETVLGSEYSFAMTQKPTTMEEGLKQVQILNELSGSIESKLDEEKRSESPDSKKIEQLEKQLDQIRTRKGVVEGEMPEPLAVKTVVSENPTADLAKLKAEENDLKSQQNTASAKDKIEIEKKLAANKEAQQKTETAIQEKTVLALGNTTAEKKQALESITTSDPIKNVVLNRVSKTSNSKDLVLEKTSQVTLLDATTEYLNSQQIFEETKQIVQTETALKEQKRRFSIEIGEIESELQKSNQEPKQVEELINQKKTLEDVIAKIDQQLATIEREKTYDVINDPALAKTVSVAEEQAIASSKEYPKLREQQQEINRLKESVNQTKIKLEEKRKEYVETKNPADRMELQTEIQQLSNELNTKVQQIAQKESALNVALNGVEGDKEAWKNVLTREVQPKSAISTSIADVLAPEVGTGFEIKKENVVEPRFIKKAIPLGVKAPTGLVYRVQVGAFAKPIPEDLFKEFTPVTGEKLDNGITRYLAGYFGNRQKVLDAQQDIRALGYKDAFVVAYCDGKRISLAEARQLEEQGLCKPMSQDSIVMEVIQNAIAQLPLDTIAKYKTEPKVSDYNKAPGAVTAIAIEEIKGLFYTVQVGVYNRPATKEQLHDINPLVTRRLENGQIRYSTGTFRSVDEARPKKAEAVEKGVSDAFITAYFNGERISLQEAKKLLAEQGEAILFKEQELPKVLETPVSDQVAKEYAKENPVIEKPILNQYALISKETYPEYPRKIMNQLRVQGDFYFDQTDSRIKTQAEEALPRLVNNTVLFDTLVQIPLKGSELNELNRKLVVGIWDFKKIPGSWANWLLRLTLPYEIKASSSTIELSMNVSGEGQRKQVEALFISQGAQIKTE
jgi:epidermal growth factor receptor substrate 15